MPRLSGMEALRELDNARSPVRTVVLTASIDRQHIVHALQLGATGIVLKTSGSKVLLESIYSVLSGRYWIGHESISDVVKALRDLAVAPGCKPARHDFGLTQREREIVTTVVGGFSNRDIAQRFSISEQTVKNHLSNIFDKLGVSNRLELALFALNHHLAEQI